MRFEVVSSYARKFKIQEINIPQRHTSGSAGYDLHSNEDKILEPGQQHLFWTDIKVKLKDDECLLVMPRSSIGIKYNLMLANSIGLIDASYYQNPDNDGNIGICLYNYGKIPVGIKNGERIAQGIIVKYVSDNEEIKTKRKGGFGSTNE